MLVAVDLQLLLSTPDGVRCSATCAVLSIEPCFSKMAHIADHLSFPQTFLLPCCAIFRDGGAVRGSLNTLC